MLRLDRLITLSIFQPLAVLRNKRGFRIPILMYHSISHDEEHVHPYFRICTSPEMFAYQMSFLAEEGYRTITLKEVPEAVANLANYDNTERLVVLTFDDGYSDFYTHACPVLQHYGFSATVFLSTAYIGGAAFKGKKCLTWRQVKTLADNGVAFGSHTHSHPQLSDLSPAGVASELTRSKALIEDKLGVPVTEFSYPYRFPVEKRRFMTFLKDELQAAGYDIGVTTLIGRVRSGDDRLFMKRLPVNSFDDDALMNAKLLGAYDWLRVPQSAIKKLRSLVR